MDSSAAANGRLAALEDEVKIIKGEVKQVLTEIRSAILAKDSPFEDDAAQRSLRPVHIVPAVAEQPARVEQVEPSQEAVPQSGEQASGAPARAEAQHRATQPGALATLSPATVVEPEYFRPPRTPSWSLLTIANIASWAEEALERVGAQRLNVLLDLCEVSGYLTSEERGALNGITALEASEPMVRASAGDVAVLLNQLEAFVGDREREGRRLTLRRA